METLNQEHVDSPEQEAKAPCSEQPARDRLAPWRRGHVVTGCSPHDIAGEGTEENKAQVTTFEIELLIMHWAAVIRHARVMQEGYQTYMGTLYRLGCYANRRLRYFETILGEEKVDAIVDEILEGIEEDIAQTTEGYEAFCRREYPESCLPNATEREQAGPLS